MPRLLLLLAALLGIVATASAQELRVQPTPFSVWLDLRSIGTASLTKASLPIWIESVQRDHTERTTEIAEKTTFRIRLRRLGNLNNEIQLRIFFDDEPGESPEISGWTETGSRLYSSSHLGAGLSLPTSEKITIPVADLDYLEINAPGDGSSVRGAFLTTLRKYEGRHALDFEPLASVDDPFNASIETQPSHDDSYLYGRVKATLDAGIVKLTPRTAPRTAVEFELDAVPLVAVVTFEILDVDPIYPPDLRINDHPLGHVALQLPDLADPGFQGEVRPLERDMRFHYTGWIRCQQIIPGSSLAAGLNKLEISLNKDSTPIAIRSVEIELKHHWHNLDYELSP